MSTSEVKISQMGGLSKVRKAFARMLSCVQLCATPWAAAHQAPLSMESPRQECWSGVPFPSPEDLASPASSGGLLTTVPPGKAFGRKQKLPTCFSFWPLLQICLPLDCLPLLKHTCHIPPYYTCSLAFPLPEGPPSFEPHSSMLS